MKVILKKIRNDRIKPWENNCTFLVINKITVKDPYITQWFKEVPWFSKFK